MAFNQSDTRKAKILLVALSVVLIAVLGVISFTGVLSPKGNTGSDTTTQEDNNAAADATASGGKEDGGEGDTHSVKDIDTAYQENLNALEEKAKADPTDITQVLNIANAYFDWGTQVLNHASNDAETTHAQELFSKAVEYYDSFLSGSSSNAAVVDRAIALFYSGDVDQAIADLEEFCAGNDSFAPAWANLGMFYEQNQNTDKAVESYERAIECDKDNKLHVKEYAEARLAEINK